MDGCAAQFAVAIHTGSGFVNTSFTPGPPRGNLHIGQHQTRDLPRPAIQAYCTGPEFRLAQRNLKDSVVCADDQS
jgi:hypothetical protein